MRRVTRTLFSRSTTFVRKLHYFDIFWVNSSPMWNVHDNVVDKMERTNDNAEAASSQIPAEFVAQLYLHSHSLPKREVPD